MRAIPLTKANRVNIARAFYHHKRYDVVLDSVIEAQMGKAYTDHIDECNMWRVEVAPFNYFAGDAEHGDAADMVKKLKTNSFIMPSGPAWMSLISQVFENQVHVMARYLYRSDALDINKIRELMEGIEPVGEIHRLDLKRSKKVYDDPKSIIYLSDFESGADFYQRGVGFVMEAEGKIIGTAYSSMISGTKAQIALNVTHSYRKKGIATALAIHFVAFCLENNIEPVWVANNPETCKLAERLGFVLDDTFDILYIAES